MITGALRSFVTVARNFVPLLMAPRRADLFDALGGGADTLSVDGDGLAAAGSADLAKVTFALRWSPVDDRDSATLDGLP